MSWLPTRRLGDAGSVRVVLLVLVSLLAAGTVAVVQVPLFTADRSQALTAEERLVNSLDAGLAVVLEGMRLAESAPACPAEEFVLRDADDASTHRPPARPINVRVRCEARGETFRFLATGYQVQPDCIPETGSRSMAPALEADVTFPVLTGNQKIAKIATRRLVPEAERCQLEPGVSPFDE